MKQNKRDHQFIILIAMLVLSFCLWIYALISARHPVWIFVAMIPMILIVIALRIRKEKNDEKGVFTQRQALRFYKKCSQAGVDKISAENEAVWRDVYLQTVGEFPNKNLRDNIRQAAHVYKEGEYPIRRGVAK